MTKIVEKKNFFGEQTKEFCCFRFEAQPDSTKEERRKVGRRSGGRKEEESVNFRAGGCPNQNFFFYLYPSMVQAAEPLAFKDRMFQGYQGRLIRRKFRGGVK